MKKSKPETMFSIVLNESLDVKYILDEEFNFSRLKKTYNLENIVIDKNLLNIENSIFGNNPVETKKTEI